MSENSNTENLNQGKKKSPILFFSSWGKILTVIIISLTLFFVSALVVVLTLTESEGLVSVPSVKHKDLVDVYNSLVEKGLKVDIQLIDIPELDKGYIINQSPAAGVLVKAGSKVKLKVARGIQFCNVPNLIGMPRNAVSKVLDSIQVGGKDARLVIGQEAYVPSMQESYGAVLDQMPRQGERVRIGSPIHLLISQGKATHSFRMANYVNQDIDLLYTTFAIRNMYVLYKTTTVKDKQKHGKVFAQYPVKGTQIKKGESVTFTVGIFDEDLYHRIGYEVIKYKVPKDLNDKEIEIFIEDNYPKRQRYKTKAQSSETLLAIIRREGDARITVESEGKVFNTIQIKENTERK